MINQENIHHLLQPSITLLCENLNLGYMQATHTAVCHTGPFLSSVHQLHLHYMEQEDTHRMSTHCQGSQHSRYGCLDHLCAHILYSFTP